MMKNNKCTSIDAAQIELQNYVSIWTNDPYSRVGGGTQYKTPYRDVPPTWVAKSTSRYMNDPL